MEKLEVIVLTYNESVNLPDCLASVAALRAPVFVVDSGSQDDTIQIARSAGARVFEHPFEHYAAQRNWSQENLPLSAEWVLHLDADERLTPELAAEILSVVERPDDAVDGYMLRKRTIFLGRWIKHGGHYPSYHLRLYRRAKGQCEDRRYDQHFVVRGMVKALEHDYMDVVASDLQSWTVRHARWAAMEADEITAQEGDWDARVQSKFGGNPIERRRWLREGFYNKWPLFARALLYGSYRYIFKLGFLDGTEGLIFHFLQGCWFRFLVDATIYERRLTARKTPRPVALGK